MILPISLKKMKISLSFTTLFALLLLSSGVAGQAITETYNTTGTHTFTVPAGVTEITVEVWGAGGGGGGSNSNNNGGSGGGGGGYTMQIFSVNPGDEFSYSVGAGGTAGANSGGKGDDGGKTTFSTLTANGGTGGGGNAGTPGTGGTAENGISGANGSQGGNSGGNGGAGANGGAGGTGKTDAAGGDGSAPGGGGGGGERYNGLLWGIGASNYAGGSGANGQVIITYVPGYLSQFNSMDIGSPIWYPGETRTISVTVTNAGQATWTNASPVINIGVKWNAESDYPVRVNANGLAPGATQTYNFTVTAPSTIGSNNLTFDVVKEGDCWFGNNNGSCGPGNSVFKSEQLTIVSAYYSKSTDNANVLTNWTANANGTGANPANFTSNNQCFIIQNGHTITANVPWAFSGTNKALKIQNGGVLTENNNITLTSTVTLQVDNGGTLNHNVNNLNIFSGDVTIESGSTVSYGNAGDQQIYATDYGNLTVLGGGTKTIQGNVRVNNTLSLSNGNISLGSGTNNLTISNNGSISGTFGSNHMIICDGNGSLIREGTSSTDFQMVYPVGTGSVYSPMNITYFASTGSGSVSVRVAGENAPHANPTDLQRHWVTSTQDLTDIAANTTFTFVADDVLGNDYEAKFWAVNEWLDVPGGTVGATSFSAVGVSNLSGTWTAREPIRTYYSYQSGPWTTPATWTTDPSGTLSVSPGVPGTDDRVVILNGRTVTSPSGSITVFSVQLNEGGTLDLGATTGHNLGNVEGQGLLRLSTSNFPEGNFDNFTSSTGGTVEYFNTIVNEVKLSHLTYNNLIINLDDNNKIVYILDNLLIHGDFTVKRGVFRVSDNVEANERADLKLDFKGNVTVSENGSIILGSKRTNTTHLPSSFGSRPFTSGYPSTGMENEAWVPRYYDIYHKIRIAGDFTNNGTVKFISNNITYPNFKALTPQSAATVIFTGIKNTTLTCNGYTDFYNLILDKGTDQTYELTIDATDHRYFRIFGRNDMGGEAPNDGNPGIRKSLWIKAGTMRLIGKTTIASLSEGECNHADGGPNSDIYIPEKGAMIIDGPEVLVLSTADTWQEVNHAWGFSATSNVYGVSLDGCSSFSIRGKVILNDGYLSTRESGGIIFWPGANGTLEVHGGKLDAPQIRSADGEDALTTFVMTGGEIQLRGQYKNNVLAVNSYESLKTLPISFTTNRDANSLQKTRGTFNIAQASNVFEMHGGTINIYDICNDTNGFAIEINAAQNNINVTGGNFNLYTVTNTRHDISSTAPINNLALYRQNAGTVRLNKDIQILNDLLLYNNTNFSTQNNNNIAIGGNFTIDETSTYTPGTNTTTFNGNGNQTFLYSGTITNGLNSFTLAGTSDLTLSGTRGTLEVRSNLELGSGTTLRDGTKVITVAGNISNSGTHLRPAGAAGRIELTGNANQTITGDGKGSFNNLSINKSGGSVTLANPMAVNGDLRLVSNHRLSIGNNTLTLGSNGRAFSTAATTEQIFNANKMIVTNGLASDGGVKKIFSNTNEFVYPFGFQLDATHYYMPAYIQFSSAPTQWGSITSRPVNERHYLAQGTTNAITAYWKNTSVGFSGIASNSVTHRYFYNASGVNSFVEGNEANYIPAVYRSGSSWVTIPDVNQVDQSINQITFTNQSVGSGEYTAGETSAFEAIPILYSSSTPTFWDESSTWSTVGVGEPGGDGIPGSNTIVIIGDDANKHTVTILTANVASGALFISEGSMLDIGTTQGHNFAAIPEETIAGAGTLRISSNNYFPAGDFGDFIGPNGGTVEYFSNSVQITVPSSSAGGLVLNQYNKLILNHRGNVVNLPDMDLTIHKDITVKGSDQSARTNTGSSWATLNVLGDFNIESGTFIIMNGTPQKTLRIYGDVNVASGATFGVRSSAANTKQTLELYGDIINKGTFNLHQTNNQVSTVFKGTDNTVIAGDGATYNFYDITVDKGSDATPVVRLESVITTGITNPFLTLTNGTFRVDKEGLTVTITDGGTSFAIPTTAALSVQNGDVRVAYGTGNLILAGRLEVLGGNMFIGNPETSNNNSIEYAAAGAPVIDVRGGNLSVNGQIRRSTTITSGSLNYIQSGGTVTIYGKNRISTRGLIEIANTNSLFSMSGGTLQFDKPSALGTTFGDIYIRPDASQVTGGTLQMGLNGSAVNHTFRLSSSSPLWNVSVGANGSDQILQNDVLALSILNNLTINGNSQFNANGLNLNIGGNFTNNNNNASAGIANGGFLAGSSTQTLTFNGSGAQNITGNGTNLTNFANLTIASGGTVALQSNSALRVNGNLNLSTGILNDGGNTISVVGNITNTSTHTSSTVDGGLTLIGTQNQNLNGVGGTYGNLMLNNISGATLQNNITINGRLTFTNGSIYIDDYQVVFGESASIGGTPDKTRMLLLNGVLSDQGVRKQFGIGASSFTFPIGVSGKYTPATYNITTNSESGTITVRPINRRHPAIATPSSDNELAYYWKVDSTGFGSNLDLTHTYTYKPDDAKPIVANYVVGLYKTHEYRWYDLGNAGTPGQVNSGSNSFTISGVGYVSGDFTAGEADNFTPPLETYYSRYEAGNWFIASHWLVGGPSGAGATQIPIGNPVVIQENHTMTLNDNSAYSVSVEVIGTLACGNTVFHDLGTVFGTGKIEITSTNDGFFVFPGGSFDEFLETPGTIVEFKGTNTASLPPKPGNIYKPFQNVVFSGTGQKNMSSESMRILGNLTISSDTKLNNSLYNKSLYVSGSWINENTGTNMFVPGTGTVYFEGSSLQNITVAARETFYNLTMINTGDGAEITGTSGIDITRRLTLTQGVLKSYIGKEVTLLNTNASIAVSGGNASSFVDGPLRKRIINGQSFNFPVGNTDRLGRISLTNTSAATSPALWATRYINNNPNDDGYFTDPANNLNPPLTDVSDNEYWIVDRPTGGTPSANISLRWDQNSFPSYTSSTSTRPLLRVVEYENTATTWTQRGDRVYGTEISGTVSTTTPVTEEDFIFTIGVIGVTASFDDLSDEEICDNDEIATIPVNLTGTPPWTLSYRTIGSTTTNFTESNIMTSPYNIQLRGSDIGGDGVYDVELTSVADVSVTGVVNTETVQLTVFLTHKPSISGATSVGAGETRHYTTTDNSGSTYTWSWVGASGGSISTSSSFETNITFTNTAGTYVLQVEEVSSTGCIAVDQISIEVLNIPVPEITPSEPNLCEGTTETYSTTSIAGNQYTWTVSGGTCNTSNYNTWRTAAEGGNTIDVTWSTVGNGSITVEERVGTSTTQGFDTKGFVIYKQPATPTLQSPSESICAGLSVNIVVTNSETGVTYQLISAGDAVGGTIAGSGGSITLTIPEVLSTATYHVRAYNLGCEAVSGDFTVTAYPNPVVNWISLSETQGDLVSTICEGDPAELNISHTVTGDFDLEIFYKVEPDDDVSIETLNLTGAIENPYKYNVSPSWDGVTMPPSTTYKYRVVITDEHGCVSEAIPEANQPEITVWKRPETGPPYHIPNAFGE